MKRTEAIKLRSIIEQAVQSLPVNDALVAISLHPRWAEGMTCEAGKRYNYDGKLYEALQTHTSQADWTPDIAPGIFAVVNETHAGTKDDPIPYSGNMALQSGLYYHQDYVVYLCTRDTGNPVHHALSELVGNYVKEVM